MTAYLHHLPGRLRVRSSALRRNDSKARTAREHLAGQAGVLSVETNVTTGSLLVRYDTDRIDAQRILQALGSLGIVRHPSAPRCPAARSELARATEGLVDRFASKLVETVIERSAVALVAALI